MSQLPTDHPTPLPPPASMVQPLAYEARIAAPVPPLRTVLRAIVAFLGSVVAIFLTFAVLARPASDPGANGSIQSGNATLAIVGMIGVAVVLGVLARRCWREPRTRGYAIGIALGLTIGLLFAIVCIVA